MFPIVGNPPEAAYPIIFREYQDFVETNDSNLRRAVRKYLLPGTDYTVGVSHRTILLPDGILKLNAVYAKRGVDLDLRRQLFYKTKPRSSKAVESIRRRARAIVGKP